MAYNKVVEEITVTETKEHSSYITYLYNVLYDSLIKLGGSGELSFGDERSSLFINIPAGAEKFRARLADKLGEVIGIGYKYEFLQKRLSVCLSAREKRFLCAALIAADYESDKGYIRRKLGRGDLYAIDGVFAFRLTPLREKWEKIASYV
ncbi:MAG: hypothetical protein K2N84_02350, partial [Clostridia bacterium]|nr:hypothetical protein [Clostridia bacterium]